MNRILLKNFGQDAVLFSDSDKHVDAAVIALTRGDTVTALDHFKAAFDAHPSQGIITRVFKEAKHISDPFFRADYYVFAAAHGVNHKTAAIAGAIGAVEEAAKTNEHEATSRRVLDIFQILPTDFSGIMQRGRMLEIWHKQITAMLQRDELAGTHHIKIFLGGEVVRRSLTGLDDVTAGVLNGAVARVLAEQKHAAIPTRITAKQYVAAHNAAPSQSGKPYLN